MNPLVTQLIEEANPDQQPILEALRKIILDTFPDIKEEFKWSRPVYSFEKIICYFVANKKHVNLGFYNFNQIVSGTELLEGTGKNLRHIKLRTLDDVQPELFAEMLRESATGI